MNLQRRWGGGGEGGGRDSTKQSRCSGAGWRSSHHFVPPPLVPGSQHCTVLLSLASEKLEDDDKTMIAVRLVSAKTKGDTFGTANLSQLTEKTELWDLVTSNSWELFILKMCWLAGPAPQWDTSLDYIRFRDFVRAVKVMNDCAERESSWLLTTASPSPRTARRGAKSTRWWRQSGNPNQTPRGGPWTDDFFMCLCIDSNELLI